MKRTAGVFAVALLAGAFTLGAYKIFFEKENITYVPQQDQTPFLTASNRSASAAGAGINEVDFTLAAEKTVNAVVHVKNVTNSRSRNSIAEFFYGSEGSQRPQIGTGSGVIISPDGIKSFKVFKKSSIWLMMQMLHTDCFETDVLFLLSHHHFSIVYLSIRWTVPCHWCVWGRSERSQG